jgi:hypothetical protein
MKKRILIASSLLSITLALAQPNILFAEDVAVAPVHVTESQSLASKKAGPSDEIKKAVFSKTRRAGRS